MKRSLTVTTITAVLVAGWAVFAAARQEPPQIPTGAAGENLQQKGGRIIDQYEPKTAAMEHARGRLIRPLVPEGGSGAHAPEEGTFTLRPGDMLEIECGVPKNQAANLTYKSEDESIIKLLPVGVRELVPVSMIGGEPKPITGFIRYTALFQAESTGETTIRVTIGRKALEYKVKVEEAKSPGAAP